MYLHRLLEKTLKRAEKTFPAVVITGPRQAGKSTLLKNYFAEQKHTYITLDDPNTRALIAEDPKGFLSALEKPVIIDEFQYMPELASYIKMLIDEDRSPGSWFLSGSQQFYVMKQISDSLAGRIAVLALPPFQLKERQKTASLENFFLQSTYPELVVNAEVDRKLWYSSYLQTYLERDVRGLLNVADLRDFENCLRLLAARTGQELNYSSLARDLGVSGSTIKRWISVLESSYIIFQLPPFYKNYGKRIIKAPKIYFFDIGLVNYLVGINSLEMAKNGPMAGALFETLCVSEIMKNKYAQGDKPELYYWRSQSGVEIDLIVPENGAYIPMEIKLASTIKPAFFKNIKNWLELTGQEYVQGRLITNCPAPLPLPGFVKNIYWGDL